MDTSKSTHTLNVIEGTTGTHRTNLEAKMRTFEVIKNEKQAISDSENVQIIPPNEDGGHLTPEMAMNLAYKEIDWSDIVIIGYEKDTGDLFCYSSHMQRQALLWMLETMKMRIIRSNG